MVEATLNSVSGEFGEWFVMGQNDVGIMGRHDGGMMGHHVINCTVAMMISLLV